MYKLKNIILALFLFWFGILIGAIIIINNIKIDGVNELDNGIITIECFGHYFDYYYERGNNYENNI